MSTKDLANVAEQSGNTFKRIRKNWDIKNKGITEHKYDPQSRFKDYFAMRKTRDRN
jgi:hypothetical protein